MPRQSGVAAHARLRALSRRGDTWITKRRGALGFFSASLKSSSKKFTARGFFRCLLSLGDVRHGLVLLIGLAAI